MDGFLLAGGGTFVADQAVLCDDLMPVLLYDRFGRADTNACPTVVAKEGIHGHGMTGFGGGKTQNQAIGAEVSVPELLRKKQGQGRTDKEEGSEHGEFSSANQGEDEEGHEDSHGGNPYPGFHEKLRYLAVFQMKLLLDGGNRRHDRADRTKPAAIDSPEEEGPQEAEDKENHPELRFAQGNKKGEQGKKENPDSRLPGFLHD